MYDTSYHPLSPAQFLDAVAHGSFAGTVSPLATEKDALACVMASQRGNVDPRIPVAVCWQEGHMGTDTGLVAASVYNFGGIKWANQPGAYDSGIPADTGGTYAGFPDSSQYWSETVRTLTNDLVGPYLRAGDVQGAFRKYTNWDNPASGDGKLAIYQWLLANEPVSGVTDLGVYGEDIIRQGETALGRSIWQGEDGNPGHPSAFWCEAFAEWAPRALGLTEIRRSTALDKKNACAAQGFLNTTDPPEHGAWVFFDERFYFQGHIGIWNAETQQLLCTLTEPKPNGTIGYIGWGPGTYGYAGWARIPGVVAPKRVRQAVDGYTLGGNPYGQILIPLALWPRWDALNTMGQPLDHPGVVNPDGLALPMIGFPKASALTRDGRVMQRYERGWLATQGAPAPFDIVALMPEEYPQ